MSRRTGSGLRLSIMSGPSSNFRSASAICFCSSSDRPLTIGSGKSGSLPSSSAVESKSRAPRATSSVGEEVAATGVVLGPRSFASLRACSSSANALALSLLSVWISRSFSTNFFSKGGIFTKAASRWAVSILATASQALSFSSELSFDSPTASLALTKLWQRSLALSSSILSLPASPPTLISRRATSPLSVPAEDSPAPLIAVSVLLFFAAALWSRFWRALVVSSVQTGAILSESLGLNALFCKTCQGCVQSHGTAASHLLYIPHRVVPISLSRPTHHPSSENHMHCCFPSLCWKTGRPLNVCLEKKGKATQSSLIT
mmetsp:Transcript_15691/g.28166  ORF Transcript_15691/g.28166 Transcript_15691/m.28166 type:complete len:317 (+) Transcript_15691:328-1278(+)